VSWSRRAFDYLDIRLGLQDLMQKNLTEYLLPRNINIWQELIHRDRCTACHGYGRADEIKSTLASTDTLLSRIDRQIRGFHRVGYDTKDLETRLFQVRNAFHRLFHTVDVERIRTRTAAFQEPLSELDRRLEDMRRTQAQRRLQGAVVVGLLAVLTVVLALLRLTYRREEREPNP
jgi:hypothetical protein